MAYRIQSRDGQAGAEVIGLGNIKAAAQTSLKDAAEAQVRGAMLRGRRVRVASDFATGTTQPKSLADAVMDGLAATGSTSGSGTAGIVAVSTGSANTEQDSGAGQASLGDDSPLQDAAFAGKRVKAMIKKADNSAVILSDVLSTAAGALAEAEVYGYLAYRSDLGGDAKWRLWFYYTAPDGTVTAFTPDTNLTGLRLYVPSIGDLSSNALGADFESEEIAGGEAGGLLGPKSVARTHLADAVTGELDGLRTDVNTAQGTADDAATAAGSAQTAADNAQGTADDAQADATTALANASTAQTTANNAATAASNAQTTADTAETDAQTAITNAATAQSAAEAAQGDVDALDTRVGVLEAGAPPALATLAAMAGIPAQGAVLGSGTQLKPQTVSGQLKIGLAASGTVIAANGANGAVDTTQVTGLTPATSAAQWVVDLSSAGDLSKTLTLHARYTGAWPGLQTIRLSNDANSGGTAPQLYKNGSSRYDLKVGNNAITIQTIIDAINAVLTSGSIGSPGDYDFAAVSYGADASGFSANTDVVNIGTRSGQDAAFTDGANVDGYWLIYGDPSTGHAGKVGPQADSADLSIPTGKALLGYAKCGPSDTEIDSANIWDHRYGVGQTEDQLVVTGAAGDATTAYDLTTPRRLQGYQAKAARGGAIGVLDATPTAADEYSITNPVESNETVITFGTALTEGEEVPVGVRY